MKSFLFIILSSIFLISCGEDITPTDNESGEKAAAKADEREVDATDTENAVYYNFSTGEKLEVTDAKSDSSWHISFIRHTVYINSGSSGPGNVTGGYVEGADYDSIKSLPAGLELKKDNLNEDPGSFKDSGLAFEGWFPYSIKTHILSPTDRVYFINVGANETYKIKFLGYYGLDGSSDSAFVSYRFAKLDQ